MQINPDQFNAAYGKLPFPIREFIAGEDLGNIAQEVGKEHGLHVDTVGALERETLNMLLGLINPEQFVGELKSVGIPQESIGAIVEELNAKIFIPLREKMRNQPEEAVAPKPKPDTSSTDWVQVTAPAAPAIATPSAAPVVQATPVPTPIAATPEPAPYTHTTVTPEPAAQVIETLPTPVATPIISAMSVPPYVIQPASSDSDVVQKIPLQPAPAPAQPTSPTPPAKTQSTENRDALHAVLKEYGVDPYREPAE